MSFDAAIILAFFILFFTVLGILMFVGARRRAEVEDELGRVASARGWKFENRNDKGYRIYSWSGSTDGVPWTAESLRRIVGENKRNRRRRIARWHGGWHPGVSAPIVCMGVPKGKENIGEGIAAGDGFFATMARKAAGFAFDNAIDVYFGEAIGQQVDAGAMHRVDGQRIPGFIVMAASKDEGARILGDGLEKALAAAVQDQSSILSNEDRPWILLRPDGISLARMEPIRDVNELDGFIRAGVALTRAFKFGRVTS